MKQILIMYSRYTPSERHVETIRQMAVNYVVSVVDSVEEAVSKAQEAEIILGHRYLRQTLPYAEQVRWIQSTAGGGDHLPIEAIKARNAVLTRMIFSSGGIARHAVMLALACSRRLDLCMDYQKRKVWGDEIYQKLFPAPRKALILGFGAIGKAIARILKSMEIEVWGVKRSADDESMSLADRLYTDDSWEQVLQQVDMLFLSLPNDPSTEKIVSAERLERLSPRSIVVNIARGEVVDMDALASLLKAGRVGGAGLDVFPGREPLSADSLLWDIPNLIITPYMSGRYADRGEDIEAYVEKQVNRYFRNGELENRVL